MLNIRAETFLASLTALSLADLSKGSQECFLCFEAYGALYDSRYPIRLSCNHIICKDCLAKWTTSSTTNANNNSCPFCRAELFERDDDDALTLSEADQEDDDLLRGPQLPETLRLMAQNQRAPSPAEAEGQRQRGPESQRVLEHFEQFDREIRALYQPLRDCPAPIQPLRETAVARDEVERLRWYRPRHESELARFHQERARARVAMPRDLASRRRPYVHEVPRLVRSDADYEGLVGMTGMHVKEAGSVGRSDEVYNGEARVNRADCAVRDPAARMRGYGEEVRNNEDCETEPRRFGQGAAAPVSFAARMSARAAEVPKAIETPKEWDDRNRRMAKLRQSATEEGTRIDEVVNRYIRHEEDDAALQWPRRQSATLGTGIGGADVRGRPRLGEEVNQIPTADEPGTRWQRHGRRMSAVREETARGGARAFGFVSRSSRGRGSSASPQWLSGGLPALGAGIGGVDITARPLLP